MKASLQDFITKIFTQIKNNYGNVDNTSDEDKPVSTAQAAAIAIVKDSADLVNNNLKDHITNTDNPHGVTKTKVGLGNVPNVATNDQTPTFTVASSRTNIISGEKLSVILGKIMKFFTDLKTVAFTGSYSDLSNKPTIPTVGNGTITVTQNGNTKGTFTTNQSGNTTIALTDENTDTKVTAVGNHYTPSGGTTTSASGGILTDITNSSSGVQVVTGVTKDAAGHVTGVTSVALKSTNTNTTYSNMTAATSSAAGKAGLVPAPAAGKQASFLRGDGTWVIPTNTVTTATTTGSGNAVTAITASNGALTITKGATFLTSHQDISGKMDKANPTGTGSFSLNRKSGSTVGSCSFAEGFFTTASGNGSHAEGVGTNASGDGSHTEGDGTTAYGSNSHTEGVGTIASGNGSHAEGTSTIANGENQHVQGKYNVADTTSAFIIGNGSGTGARSNAMKVDWSGNLETAGDIKDGSGNILSKAHFNYYTLLSGETSISSTTKTLTLWGGRKFSSYPGYITFIFKPSSDGIARSIGCIPLTIFKNLATFMECIYVGGTTSWFKITYKTDTTVEVSSGVNGTLFLYALTLTAK